MLPAEALAPRDSWPLCVNAALAVRASVPCALLVDTPDTVESPVPWALPVGCAEGVEAPPLVEGVTPKDPVCTTPEGDTSGDTEGEDMEVTELASVACPDRLAESVGLEGVGMEVGVTEEVKEAVEVGVGVEAVEGVAKEDATEVPLDMAVAVKGAEGVGDQVPALDMV